MSRISWGALGERFYETGVDRGVLYVSGQPAAAWNGLISVVELPTGGDTKSFYLDGLMYLQIPSAEEFQATINAFYRPAAFAACDGIATGLNGLFVTGQPRKPFDFCYRTRVGNDVDGIDYGYKLHLVYNALASPSQRSNNTLRDSADPSDYSWQITAKPISVEGFKNTAHLIIESYSAPSDSLSALEDIIYGTEAEAPRLPLPAEIQEIFGYILVVTDNGDGTFTVTGPEEMISLLDLTTFQIISPSAIFIDAVSYTLSST